MHPFALRIRGQCSDLQRCLYWWMVEAINDGLHEAAEADNLILQPIQPLHLPSVERLHCTEVEGLHWSLH